MGGCYSVHLMFPIKKKSEKNKEEIKYCFICKYKMLEKNGIFVQCNKCKIQLHKSCALKYKSNTNTLANILFCPHCKYRNSLFCYDNYGYDYKIL